MRLIIKDYDGIILNYTQNKFNEAYGQAVIQALSILGKDLSAVIISYIKDRYSVNLSDTADNPQALSNALYAVIDGGTRIIQRRILRLLYNRIGVELPFAITSNFEDKVLMQKRNMKKCSF
jgi:hypothetical protein